MTAVTHPRTPSLARSSFRGGRFYVWLTLFALIVAAISLHWPSTPSYDPWSWLIWGREIFHGQLTIAGGSSWKPLPVIFTTVFALFGSAQPDLWLIVARAGALMSVLMSAKLAARVTWAIVSQGRERGWLAELGSGERLAALAPVALAGAITLVGTGLTPTYPVPMMLGYSEGLAFALVLVAIERAWDGHHRQAFTIGMFPCLDRPELWIVWGLYGLWLMWRDRRAIPLVLGLAALMLALWVVPQVLGGGSILGLASHARHNHSQHSAVNSSFPFWHELSLVLWPLAIERVEAAALIVMALAVYLVVRDRRACGGWTAAIRSHAGPAAAAAAATAGYLWWLGVSLETQAGFAGNTRYAILGGLLVYVGGAAGYGWACLGLARLAGSLLSRRRRRVPGWSPRVSAATGLMLLVFLFVPGWFAHRLPSIASIRYALRYQARLREEVSGLIQRSGGAQKLLACGSVMANNYQVTMVAWYLDVPIPRVSALPRALVTGQPGPNVILQDAASADAVVGPTAEQIQAWEQAGSRYAVVKTDPVTLYRWA